MQVRPEDIDLPPCVPPPSSTQPPPLVSDGAASVEKGKKSMHDPALKAKTKKMIEMQLKFSRKKLRDTVNPSVPAVLTSETINTCAEHARLPREPSDSPENIDKMKSPKERPPPPPPMRASTPDQPASAEPDNIGMRESLDAKTFDGASKLLDLQITQKLSKSSSDDSETKEQIAIIHPEFTPIILNVLDSTFETSDDNIKYFENPKLFSYSGKNLASEFQIDSQVFGKEATMKMSERTFGSKDEITSGKQPGPVLADVAVGMNTISENQPKDKENAEEEKVLICIVIKISIRTYN